MPVLPRLRAGLRTDPRTQLVADASARLVYHPLSFLGEESERAANAFGCSVDEGRPSEYVRVLFENQPAEGTGGFTNEDLVALGESAGVTGGDFETCVERRHLRRVGLQRRGASAARPG